jgi:hypothetical protein
MEVGSGASDFFEYAKKINLATGGAESIPFGYDLDNIKAIAALKESQDLITQTKNNVKSNTANFEEMNQQKQSKNSDNRKGTLIDVYA